MSIFSETTDIYSAYPINPNIKLSYYSKENIIIKNGESDRIIGYVDDLEAIKQAIFHILSVERYANLIYNDNYGVELEQYIGKGFEFLEATIEDTLKEALTYDLRISNVVVNNIQQIDKNKALINYTVYTIYGNLILEVGINV